MDDRDWIGVERDSGELYERLLVPALFQEWALILLAVCRVFDGDEVLDVACGTGVVARQAVGRVGSGGSVIGVDLSESMLRVAERREPSVDWRVGDAQSLPFEAESFDVVVSQAGLMFFPDPVAAISEMRRVLRPGGRLAVQVWGSSRANENFAAVVGSHFGAEMQSRYLSPWSFTDPKKLLDVAERAGFDNAEIHEKTGTSRFASVEAFIAAQTSILLAGYDTQPLAAATTDIFTEYVQPDGSLHIPSPGNIATATKT